jgi:ATP-dependent Clp protease adaptor protein ClpS
MRPLGNRHKPLVWAGFLSGQPERHFFHNMLECLLGHLRGSSQKHFAAIQPKRPLSVGLHHEFDLQHTHFFETRQKASMTHIRSPSSPAGETDLAAEASQKTRLQKPPLYRVLIHNDNYTTMDFVVWVLMGIFHKPEGEAVETMWKVHLEGVGVAGIYPREIAETKIARAEMEAEVKEFPLRFSMEPEEAS